MVVSLGLDEFCSSKPRHAANNAVEEENESERIPVCWHGVCSCFWKILHPAPVCMTRITRAQSCLSSADWVSPLTQLYQTLDLHSETSARAHWEMMDTDESLVQVEFHPKN